MAYKKRADRKLAKGGKAEHLYNAQGSPEAREAEDEEDEFKRGGLARKKKDERKRGGKVEGEKAMAHLGKRARGGRTGGSPFSSAHRESNRGDQEGSPSDKAPDCP